MNKIVINADFGGFGFSQQALNWMRSHASEYNLDKDQIDALNAFPADSNPYLHAECLFPRHSKIMVDCVEALGDKANSENSSLEVVEIKGKKYMIREYDGAEEVITPNDDWIVIE